MRASRDRSRLRRAKRWEASAKLRISDIGGLLLLGEGDRLFGRNVQGHRIADREVGSGLAHDDLEIAVADRYGVLVDLAEKHFSADGAGAAICLGQRAGIAGKLDMLGSHHHDYTGSRDGRLLEPALQL